MSAADAVGLLFLLGVGAVGLFFGGLAIIFKRAVWP